MAKLLFFIIENDLSGNDDLTQDMEVFGMDMRAINIRYFNL